jgi:putative transposase
MEQAYSMDLRERVVEAVGQDGLSCNQAAARFEVAISTAIDWVNRYREAGSVAPGRSAGIGRRSFLGSIGSGRCGDARSARSPCAGRSANWPSAA